MKANIENISPVSQKVNITVEPVNLKNAQETVFASLQQKLTLPGFRKGKVPFEILQKRYAKEIQDEIKRSLFNQALELLEKEQKVKIVGVEKYEFSLNDTEGSLTLFIETLPGFTVPDYASLKLEPFSENVDEKDVDAFIERLRKQNASYEIVDRTVQKGDYVKLSYKGSIDSTLIESMPDVPKIWGTQKMTWEEAGNLDNPGVSAIIEGIVGMQKGQSKDLLMNFPSDFTVPTLVGQKAIYSVEVHEVREPKLPALDEAFCKQHQVKSLEELRESIAKTLKEQKALAYRNRQKQIISEFLTKNMDCVLPKSLLQAETEDVLQEMVNLFSGRGVNERTLKNQKDTLVEKAQAFAQERLKLKLCLQKIAEEENLRLEEKDLQQAILQEAVRQRLSVEKLVQWLKKNRLERDRLQRNAFQSKILHFIYNKIKIEPAEVAHSA